MTTEPLAFEKGISPVMELVLPGKIEALLEFRPDEALQQRIEELASKSTEGELSANERQEYEGYVRANKFIAILKRQARSISSNS